MRHVCKLGGPQTVEFPTVCGPVDTDLLCQQTGEAITLCVMQQAFAGLRARGDNLFSILGAVFGSTYLWSKLIGDKMNKKIGDERDEQSKRWRREFYDYNLYMDLKNEMTNGFHRERLLKAVKPIYASLPGFHVVNGVPYHDRGHVKYRYPWDNIDNNVLILMALQGKVCDVSTTGDSIMRAHLYAEKDFEFYEAAIDWVVAELKRHGMDAPLFFREGYACYGSPGGARFVPYKQRPLNRSGVFMWNPGNIPPTYPT